MSYFLFWRSLVHNAIFFAALKRRRQLTCFLLTGLGVTACQWLDIGTSVHEAASYFALLCTLTGCLGIYLLVRFVETIKRSGRNLWMVTDISDLRWSRADANPSGSIRRLATAPWSRRRVLEVLSGTSIWKARCVCVVVQSFLIRQYS